MPITFTNLFLIFINDLVSKIPAECKLKLFADDIKIYRNIEKPTDQQKLQKSLNALIKWASEWQLAIASHKCWVLRIGSVESALNYEINDQILEWKSSCRDLGIQIDSKLNFSEHCANVAKKANARSIQISKCFYSANLKFQVLAFTSFVRPLLEFGSIVWNPRLRSDCNLLESVQRRFTKYLFNRAKLPTLEYEQRLMRLQLDNIQLGKIEHRRAISDLKFCYKILHNLVEIEPGSLVVSQRLPGRLIVPHCSFNTRKSTFCCRIPKLWNLLETETKNAATLGTFASKLALYDMQTLLFRFSTN